MKSRQAAKPMPSAKVSAVSPLDAELRPGQSIELLKELHILTRDGKLNQDSRRKLKQVYHLYQFIEKLLQELPANPNGTLTHGGPWCRQVVLGIYLV
jgi:hypothetical protein